ncbi:MAG TPA: hypothetical protein VFV99_16860 [Kofleriaceae bacterium]|nr:hypothetical protein [Kofleriaceae bacterium]
MRWLALVLACGCASAGSQDQFGGVDGNNQPQPDGQQNPMIDSSMGGMDGSGSNMPTSHTLTQTTSQTLKAANTIACGASGTTAANNWYRVFDLPAMGITTSIAVTQVSFQVEHCHATANNGCTVAVRVGTYSATPGATLATANMTILSSNPTVTIPEIVESGTTTPGGTVNAPVSATIPAGSKLLVEVDAPDGTGVYAFYMGSNDGGESGFGYIMAPTCSVSTPTNISTLGTPAPRHLLLTVTATY